jgi:hypothetical protein
MDTAAIAAASDPQANRQFSRRWTGPPPKNRKRPRSAPGASFEIGSNITDDMNTIPGLAARRAVMKALVSAARPWQAPTSRETFPRGRRALRVGAPVSGIGADDTPLVISWFPTATPKGPALGDPEHTTWGEFCGVCWWRREGEKDGPNFVPARFKLEPDGRHVRRLKENVVSRTAVALDLEANNQTGELPPSHHCRTRPGQNDALAWRGPIGGIHTKPTHRPGSRWGVFLSGSEGSDVCLALYGTVPVCSLQYP